MGKARNKDRTARFCSDFQKFYSTFPNFPFLKGVWLGVILAGLIAACLRAAFNFNPLSVIVFAQVANGLVLPVASIFLLIVLNNHKKMKQLANNLRENTLGVLIILIVSGLGLWNIIKLCLR